MPTCKHCGCKLYNDFGLGLYNNGTGSALCYANGEGEHEIQDSI